MTDTCPPYPPRCEAPPQSSQSDWTWQPGQTCRHLAMTVCEIPIEIRVAEVMVHGHLRGEMDRVKREAPMTDQDRLRILADQGDPIAIGQLYREAKRRRINLAGLP